MGDTYKALVLRTADMGENDKLLTLLSEEKGKLLVSAKGVRSIKSKNMATCQQFSFGEYTVTERNGGYLYLKESRLLSSFFGVRADIVRLAAAAYILSVTEALAIEGEPDTELLRLTLNSLYLLSEGKRDTALIKAVFELRAMCIEGYLPDLYSCSSCGKEDAEYFDSIGGTLICRSCMEKSVEGVSAYTPISSTVLDSMRYVSEADGSRLFSFKLPEEEMPSFIRICEEYVIDQLGVKFKTLDFYREVI